MTNATTTVTSISQSMNLNQQHLSLNSNSGNNIDQSNIYLNDSQLANIKIESKNSQNAFLNIEQLQQQLHVDEITQQRQQSAKATE